jgi:hypothetical protein
VRDELACSDWAKQQTGIDPMTVAANTDSAAEAGRKAAEEQGAQQGAAQAKTQAAGSLTTFAKAMSSCLEGKGYTVN